MNTNTFGVGLGLESAWETQRTLSTYQSYPIIGAIAVSPIKLIISTVQAVGGVALSIIFGTLAALTFNDTLAEWTLKAGGHAIMGLGGFMYSISNMISLGLVGWRFEGIGKKSNPNDL